MGGHHDAWFTGSFDDATGVAAALVLARAFVEAGVRPRHPIGFLSHTAEEYGLANSRYDWCIGAWHQITHAHREWAARAPFYLNIEGSGLPEPLEVDAPPELAAWARRVCRRAARDGLLPHGFRLGEPNTLTEVWTFLAAGVPGLNVSSFSSPGSAPTTTRSSTRPGRWTSTIWLASPACSRGSYSRRTTTRMRSSTTAHGRPTSAGRCAD